MSSTAHSLADVSAYYAHLHVQNTAASAYVDSLLTSSYDSIHEMTQPYPRGQEYDIYKYQVDAYGNAYILYKKYDSVSADAYEKMTCPG